MSKVLLKCNGKPLELNAPSLPLSNLKALLDKGKHDEVFIGEDIAQRIGIKPKTLRALAGEYSRSMPGYSTKVRNGRGHIIRYWGHPKAIAELERQVSK